MGLIKEWSGLICLVSMASILFELILPPGKMEKMMHMVLSVFMICMIIYPFADRKNRLDLNIKKISSGYIDKEKTKFIKKINEQIEYLAQENIKRVVAGVLKDNNTKYEKIEIFMDTDEDRNISIIKCRIHLNTSDFNLKEKVRGDVEKKLRIKTEVIV